MSDRITLNFDANTQDVERGADRMADSLDKTSSKLDDLGTAGEDAGRSTADGIDDAATSVDGMSDSVDGAATQIGGLGQVGKQALDGDLGGAASSAAEALGSIIPQGALIGTIVGGAVGLVTQKLQDAEAQIEKNREKITALYRDAAAESKLYIDQAAIDSNVLDLLTGSPEDKQKLKGEAQAIGVDFQTYIRAQAGDEDSLTFAIKQATAAEVARREEVSSGGAGTEQRNDKELTGILKTKLALQGLAGIHQDNQESLGEYAAYQATVSGEERDQINRTSKADQDRYQALADKQAAAANPPPIQQKVLFDVDTTKLDRALRKIATSPHQVIVDVKTRDGKPVP